MASPSVASSRTRNTAHTVSDDDVVMVRALQLSEWARRNARVVIGVSAIAIVAVLAYLFYGYQKRQSEERASIAFSQVEQTALSGNATLAQRDLTTFIRRFDGTVQADQARLLLAKVHLDAGKAREAVTVLQAVEEGPATPVGAQGAMLLGAAQNQAGNRQAAIASYLRVAEAAKLQYQQEAALAEAALVRQQGGDFAGAAELYRRLIGMVEEGSFDRSMYEMRLAEAEGRALAK
ncbi:MAG TPA: tetratricopeptide repeat protein [Longimicrobiaceae bacterium]|nr:tetratricopeptide repeat protein [Longimicrobiaceae bacterium]